MLHQYRRRLLVWAILFLPLLAFSDHLYASADDHKTSAQFKLLVLGDSLSAGYGLAQHQGWVSLLQNLWNHDEVKIDVINAAISGETTDGGLARLPRLLQQHSPTHVLIELGGNDGLQGHAVQKTKANLDTMVTMAKQTGATVFIQDMEIPTNYGRRYTQMFADAFDSVAKENDITLIPFFLQDIALDPALMQKDGIHPNAEAQPVIAEFMKQQLTPLIVK
ncbi:arylesterase [Aestuariibacter sp. A3R04]|uniref:arylesterase n=1 Tax=Aestuariibacter sp. A3R04 TaxID=2841571 RepID=UPI001C09DF89|nr:arylesterase [Aestuariibacter sp. A3R04]MBU3022498.1 arylesterase [Aestuariibacter sp. A3R04]